MMKEIIMAITLNYADALLRANENKDEVSKILSQCAQSHLKENKEGVKYFVAH